MKMQDLGSFTIPCTIGDGSRANEESVDPLEVPLGPMTRTKAK